MKTFDVIGEVTVRLEAVDAMGAGDKFRFRHPNSTIVSIKEIAPPKPLDRDELVRTVRLLKESLNTGNLPGTVANNLLARFNATEGE